MIISQEKTIIIQFENEEFSEVVKKIQGILKTIEERSKDPTRESNEKILSITISKLENYPIITVLIRIKDN